MTNKQTDELAALKARIEELERANKPPEPFVPEPWTPYDPTSHMSMPPSAVREMANAIPDHVVKDIVHRGAIPPASGMSPSSSQITSVRPGGGAANVPGGGTGWQAPIPLSPPPGIQWVDAQCIADDVKSRGKP